MGSASLAKVEMGPTEVAEGEPIQVITPYECEYTVMLSPPSAPVVKESTGITMFIIDEMREAKARLAKDQLIKKMAMEQKMRREAMALEQRRVRAGQQNHVYNAHIL